MNRDTYDPRGFWLVVLCCAALSLLAPVARGGKPAPVKAICAYQTAKAPVIDGVLDDACWKRAEIRSDFVGVAGRRVERKTTIRFVFDDKALYLGMECYWDDVKLLKSGVAAIRKKYGKTPPKGSEGYSNTYGAELFLDPGATQINYYQILFNAAGQYTGNYKAIWEQFKPVHTIKSTIRGNRWTVELVYPYKGIRLGDTWGLNFCRNDETYYSLWKDVGYSYHEPKQFGHIVMGDYTQWWSSVSGPGVKAKLGQIAAQVGRPEYKRLHLDSLYAVATTKLRALEALAAKHPPKNRANFELLYRAQASFRADFTRLTDAYQTLSLMAPSARASYVVNESFDEWVWRPIKFNMTASGRKVLAAGGKLGYEHRGPLFLLPKFCQAPFGRMVEGADAYRGRSALIVAGPKGSVFGVHGPPGFPADPRQTYSYSIALKGEGTFNFRAWVQGVNPVTGKVKWLGFPNLATIKVTKKWKVYTGVLKIPTLEKDGFKFKKLVQVALVFSPKSTISVDDLRIWQDELK